MERDVRTGTKGTAEGRALGAAGGDGQLAPLPGDTECVPEPAAADIAFMRLAIEQARLAAANGEVPIGAVVVCEGEVVARGCNRRESDADPSAHAELVALVEASRRLGRWRLTGCTAYVTLEPCLMCAGLMQQARIDRCVYGAPDPKGGALGTLYRVHDDGRLNHRFEVSAGVCAQECAELLSGFFASLRAGAAAGSVGEDTGPREVAPAPSEAAALTAPPAPAPSEAAALTAPPAPAPAAGPAPPPPAPSEAAPAPAPPKEPPR